jgi:hypothetical protein
MRSVVLSMLRSFSDTFRPAPDAAPYLPRSASLTPPMAF